MVKSSAVRKVGEGGEGGITHDFTERLMGGKTVF